MNKIKDFFIKNKKNNVLLPIISVLMSFLIVIILMLATGINPLGFFRALFQTITGVNLHRIGQPGFFNPRYIGEFLQTSIIITLTGLSVAFAFRTGLFNIGAEGQLLVGACGATIIGVCFNLPMIIHLPLALITSMVCGALWGFIPGVLKARFGIHEVVVTIMLNYAGLYTTNYILKNLPGTVNTETAELASTVLLKSQFLSDLTNRSRFHWGFIIVILCIFLFHYIINKTTFGYELRSVGFNKYAAEYAGIPVKSRTVYAMTISGAFSGLAGSMLVLGTFGFGRILNAFENFGFDGLSVALLGSNTGFGVFLSGLLFGALNSAQALMQVNRIPQEIAIIASSLILIFVAMRYGITMLIERMERRK